MNMIMEAMVLVLGMEVTMEAVHRYTFLMYHPISIYLSSTVRFEKYAFLLELDITEPEAFQWSKNFSLH